MIFVSLELRLTLLRDGGQISLKTYQGISDAIDWFSEKHAIILTEENAAMFVTHLAIALERVSKAEPVAALDAMLLAEIVQNPHYADAQALATGLEKLWGVSFPESELGFIWLHLCTLLNQEGN
jgi:transcriptional regulatory protein LevR